MSRVLELMGIRENKLNEDIYPNDLSNPRVKEVFTKEIKFYDGSKLIILGAIKNYDKYWSSSVTATSVTKRGQSSGSIIMSDHNSSTEQEATELVKKFEKDL